MGRDILHDLVKSLHDNNINRFESEPRGKSFLIDNFN